MNVHSEGPSDLNVIASICLPLNGKARCYIPNHAWVVFVIWGDGYAIWSNRLLDFESG